MKIKKKINKNKANKNLINKINLMIKINKNLTLISSKMIIKISKE